MALYKYHYIELDTKRSPRISLQNIVAGETGNRLWITVTNNGDVIDMSTKEDDEFIYRVALRIDSDLGTRRQDSDDPDGGITFIEANTGDHGKINILLSADSFTVGKNRCRLEIYSKRSEDDDTLICSAEWQFDAAGNPTGENTGTAYPMMKYYEDLSRSWAVGGTGKREGEDIDNAMYYKNLAEQAVQGGIVDPTFATWLTAHMSDFINAIGNVADEWLFEHITNPSNPPLDTSLSMANAAAPANLVGITQSFVLTRENVTLPKIIKGLYDTSISSGEKIICGTENVAQLLNIKEGSFTVRGCTFTVTGNTIQITGTATAAIYFSLVDGDHIAPATLASMTLPLPVHRYTLSEVVTGTGTPTLCIRKKDNTGNIVNCQNNTAQFDMDTSTCGGAYVLCNSGTTYNCTVIIGAMPYNTTNGNTHRSETSSVTVYDASGYYNMDGYAWSVGSPTIQFIRSKIPKKPICKYSTRTIAYSAMTECLDVYIPTRSGYVNYVFGHTESVLTPSEGGGNVWRLVQVDAVTDALAFLFHITQLGETEMAIMINGRDDFIGGTTHGDEVMDANSLLFILDGKPVDVTTLTSETEFDTLQIFLSSSLYDPNDHTTHVGNHGREWRFDKDGLYIGQTIEFLANLTLSNSYAPMLCVLRGNDTASTLQVTDTYMDDGNYVPYDVSVGGFTTYPNKLKTDVRVIHLTGEDSGVEATLEIIEQPEGLNKEGTFLYNAVNTYNKIYCCLCGYGGGANTQNVSNGDKWKIKSKIRIEVG